MKHIYHIGDYIFGIIGSFAFLDYIKVQIGLLQNIDNSIKLGSSLMVFVYFGFRIYFYYHKSKGEIQLQREQIRELEIKNNEKDAINNIFGPQFTGMTKEEYLKSKEQLKGK